MSNRNLLYAFLVALIFTLSSFLLPKYLKQTSKTLVSKTQTNPSKELTKVKAESLSSLKSANNLLEYPAVLKNDQVVKVFAKASGNVSKINFQLGEAVTSGELLVKVDDIGTNSAQSGAGIKNDQVVGGELLLKQAEESLKLAKKSYDNLKESSAKDLKILKIAKDQADAKGDKDGISIAKNQLKSAEEKTKTALSSAKTGKNLADLQYQNALLSLSGLEDLHLLKSPFSGTVTKKMISEGETVAPGQLLLEISDLEKSKVQFFVDEKEAQKIYIGMEIEVKNNDGKIVTGKITAVSPNADSETRRFLIEAKTQDDLIIPAETILSVSLSIPKISQDQNSYLIPLSAITISQNENFVFLLKDGKAVKTDVLIKNISGEKAEAEINANEDEQMIVEGNKIVSDGEEVEANF